MSPRMTLSWRTYPVSQYDPAGSFIDRKTLIIDRSSIQYLRYDRVV